MMHRTPAHHPPKHWASLLMVVLGLSVCSVPAQAGLITAVINEPNDCAGFFGNNFPECNVFGLSPVIAKFSAGDISEENGPASAVNSALYPSVTGSEWLFIGSTSGGMWTYTPGADDPTISYYTVKAANQFSLNYLVPDANDVACGNDPLNMACLEKALPFPTGVPHPWQTLTGKDVSHMTFYDSGDDGQRMPEPGTLMLLALGGLALARRRRTLIG